MAESSHQHRSCCYFKEWMDLQAQDLDELQNALANNNENTYTQLIEKGIDHFRDYMSKRSAMFHQDASGYFAPSWCTSLENSSLWIAGCRPSSYIRLLYALGSSHVESIIADLMQGRSRESLGELTSTQQLTMINNLQMKTIKEEDKLTSKLASLQEDMADHPISVIAKGLSQVDHPNEEVDRALAQHESAMANIFDEADKLRLDTLNELIKILTPPQSVDFLAASKKLHLCIREWGKRKDDKMGRKND
ncbi:hypothetical protein ACOSQ2_012138 [Xanthoceras sorbifolium]